MPTGIMMAEAQEHLSLVTIDAGTIIFTLVNTLLIFLAYRFFLHNKVVAILEKRKDAVNAEMDAAEEAKKKAEAAEKEYLAHLENSKAEAERIVQNAVAKAQARENEIIADANKNALQIKQRAEESIEKEKKKAVNEIKDQISELVVMAAGAVAEKEISEKDNEALIASFIENASVK